MKRKLIIPCLLFVAIAAIAETSLIVKPLTGEEQATALSTIGYIKMTPESLYVYSHSDLLSLVSPKLQQVLKMCKRQQLAACIRIRHRIC